MNLKNKTEDPKDIAIINYEDDTAAVKDINDEGIKGVTDVNETDINETNVNLKINSKSAAEDKEDKDNDFSNDADLNIKQDFKSFEVKPVKERGHNSNNNAFSNKTDVNVNESDDNKDSNEDSNEDNDKDSKQNAT